jgi:regulator of replication initiation timing
MREERENRRISKAELSDEILRDARLRLDALQVAVSQTSHAEDAEFTRVLESLVSENEALKHDNAELQNMLADSREDVRTLREEVEEQRAAAPYRQEQEQSHFLPLRLDGVLPSPAFSRGHHVKESWASSSSAPLPRSPTHNDGLLSPRMSGSRMRTSSYSIAQAARNSFSRTSDNGDDKSSVSSFHISLFIY